ncbi:MAG TPA: winged helix-turn-helix domain-containing protein, partial [Polyangiales bacterium]
MGQEVLVYSFGPFRLELRERRLWRDGELVPLLGKAFDTLVVLVEGAGTLQHQHALMERLWPDVVVEQNNLQQAVSLVRRALSGTAGVEIETVRGQGYRLHAQIQRVHALEPRSSDDAASAAAPLAHASLRASQRTY